MQAQLKFVILPYLTKLLMLMITLTCRVKWHNRERYQELLAGQQPFIIAMWHNCSTICAWAMKNSGVSVMVSDSRDGEYVARLAALFGVKTIRGSSSKGAKKAIRAGLELLSNGQPIAVTPDGPRGPRYKVQSGVLWFSAAANAPVLPLHIESSRQWVLNSWDGHRFPKPFSTIHIGFGEAVTISRADMHSAADQAGSRLEAAMMQNVQQIQSLTGHINS